MGSKESVQSVGATAVVLKTCPVVHRKAVKQAVVLKVRRVVLFGPFMQAVELTTWPVVHRKAIERASVLKR